MGKLVNQFVCMSNYNYIETVWWDALAEDVGKGPCMIQKSTICMSIHKIFGSCFSGCSVVEKMVLRWTGCLCEPVCVYILEAFVRGYYVKAFAEDQKLYIYIYTQGPKKEQESGSRRCCPA